MLHLYDRATIRRALSLDLDPRLHALMERKVAAWDGELLDYTEFLVVEPGDTEADIVRHIGLSPLVEPIDGIRFGRPGFHPHWDYLTTHPGWHEMIFTFGSAFAYILLIADRPGTLPELLALCRTYDGD